MHHDSYEHIECPLTSNKEVFFISHKEIEQALYDNDILGKAGQDVHKIMQRIYNECSNFYAEFEKYGIDKKITNILFQYVVSYVVTQSLKFVGNLEQRTNAILKAMYERNTWIFFFLNLYSIPTNRANQIMKIIIRFTLVNMHIPSISSENILQQAERITKLLKKKENVFVRFHHFNIAPNEAVKNIKEIVEFVLKNIQLNQPPVDIQKEAVELVKLLEKTDLDALRNMHIHGMTKEQIKAILNTITIFTLNDIYLWQDYDI